MSEPIKHEYIKQVHKMGKFLSYKNLTCYNIDEVLVTFSGIGFCEKKDNVVTLEWIQSKVQGQGDGTRVLNKLTKLADKMNVTIILNPEPWHSMNLKKLKKWYRGHGFKNYSRKLMKRIPFPEK